MPLTSPLGCGKRGGWGGGRTFPEKGCFVEGTISLKRRETDTDKEYLIRLIGLFHVSFCHP